MSHLIELKDNDFFYTAEKDVSDCINAELASCNLAFFDHVRVYNDGHFSVFSNNSSVLRYAFDVKLQMIAPVDPKYISEKFSFFILPIGSYVSALHDLASYFNLGYFVNFVERYPGYVDVHCFASRSDNSSIMNFYLHEEDKLRGLIQLFKDKCAYLIKSHDHHKRVLPDSMRPDFTGLPMSASVHDNLSFSKRQWDCIRLLKEEYSAKKIANRLNLSHRTVENYFAGIKDRLQCNKSDIRSVLEKQFGINV